MHLAPTVLPTPTNSRSKARNVTGFTRLRRDYDAAGIALGPDLVNGQVDVLGTQLEEVIE